MYGQSVVLFRKLIVWVAVFVVIELVGVAMASSEPLVWLSQIISLANWSMLTYMAYATLLSSHIERPSNPLPRLAGFVVRYAGLAILVFVLAMVVLVFSQTYLAYSYSEDFSQDLLDAEFGNALLVAAIAAELLFVLVYGLLGTCLPASVLRHRQGLSQTFRQGRSTFWATAGLLIAGPVILDLLSFGADMWAEYLSTGDVLSIESDVHLFTQGWQPDVPVVLAVVLVNLFHALSLIMTSWVLTGVYLEAVGHNKVAAVFE